MLGGFPSVPFNRPIFDFRQDMFGVNQPDLEGEITALPCLIVLERNLESPNTTILFPARLIVLYQSDQPSLAGSARPTERCR